MTNGSEAVGLVLARPVQLLGTEPFFMEFIAGVEETLAQRQFSILLHVVPADEAELEAYRRWADRKVVDAVVLVNLVQDDVRPGFLLGLDLPFLVVGEWDDPSLPRVRSDNWAAERAALAHLVGLGHRRLARVSGPTRLLHTQARTVALLEDCRAVGIEPILVEGDYTERSGVERTRELLALADRPTAILYDNDVMAVAGLHAAQDLGVVVPDQLSLIAWDDSTLCRLASPAMTTMSMDVHEYGVRVGSSVLEVIDGGPVVERWSPTSLLVQRGTTARVRPVG